MSAEVRFTVKGFVTPVDAEALKHGLKEAIRQIEQGQEIQKEYNLPDVPSASIITLAFRNSYKAYKEGSKHYGDSASEPGTDSGEPTARG